MRSICKKIAYGRKRLVKKKKLRSSADMTTREVRIERRKVRDRVRKHRMKQKAKLAKSLEVKNQHLNNLSVVEDPQRHQETPNHVHISTQSRQKTVGEQIRVKNRVARRKEVENLKEQVKLQRRIWKLQKANLRKNNKIKSPQLTPKNAVNRLCRSKSISSHVRRKLFEGYVLRAELRKSLKSLSSDKEKQIMGRLVSSRILKQYRQLKSVKGLFSLNHMRQGRKLNEPVRKRLDYVRKKRVTSEFSKKNVQDFFLSNQGSTECPGKKQGRSYNGVQRQRRYLKSDMKQLYQIFLSKTKRVVSYRTFCRFKPEWVVKPKLSARDACLCKLCENIKYLFVACKSNDLLSANNVKELTEVLCCKEKTVECLLRECKKCRDKTITYSAVSGQKPVMYYEWVASKEQKYNSKSKKRVDITITKKISKYCTVEELKLLFNSKFGVYMQHAGRFENQSEAAEKVIKSLQPREMVFLVDWSMNYVLKYGREPQSVHFGGSHGQIAFHTGRVYLNGGKAKSFCTLSEVTRHDPKAIVAHLRPIVDKYLSCNPKVNKVIFMSDGPVTQYRNRDLYWLITQYLTELFPPNC